MKTSAMESGVVLAIMYLLGLGALLSWNVLITPQAYYGLRFATTDVYASFESLLSCTFTLVGLITVVALQFVQHWASLYSRILGSLLLECVVFLIILGWTIQPLLVPLDELEKSLQEGADAGVGLLLACDAVAAIGQAVLTASMVSYAAVLGPRYIQAVSAGMGLAGVAVSLSNLCTLIPNVVQGSEGAGSGSDSAGADRGSVLSAAFYFAIACVVLLVCTAGLVYVDRLAFVRERKAALQQEQAAEPPSATRHSAPLLQGTGMDSSAESVPPDAPVPASAAWRTLSLLARLWCWALSLVLVYAVTIGVFPAVVGMLAAVGGPPWWRDAEFGLFIPIMFVLFNVGDTLGRNLPARWLPTSPHWILLAALARFIFFPLFLLAHMRQGASSYEPVLSSDVGTIVTMIVFAISNGWLTSAVFIHAPSAVAPAERKEAASMMAACLNLGLTVGSLVAFLLRFLLCGCNPFVTP